MHTQSPGTLPLPVSLEPELDLAHTHQCCDYCLSQAAEQSGESHHVLTKLHVCGMEGKRRRIASFADTGGPRAPLRSNFDDPEGWDTSFSEEECSQQDVVQRMVPVAGMVAQSSSVVILIVLGLVHSLWWNMGTKLGGSQQHAEPVGRLSRARTSRESRVETPLLPGLKSQVCKEYISRYRKSQQKWLRKIQELHHDQ